ncbi:class I SAM-dependent methyltransferase [Saccharibacillus sp. JS10]|uniref:class I SAM-dependent methyltransferase n=1 Tax=Saccharibacillus sp. JS10 TaxID=2950552 RepID=UPI0021092766|nr:class I SAM-dependent methyltransferase [Saccharibacillus sp. JS10]MCQ4087884.1 class I SAM-dependent methyltransferase [Saccharibacillus sp. JS10]
MDSKQRFSDRVDAYVKYRPDYTKAALDYLYTEVGLDSVEKIADIGAGTGIFSRLLLERESQVIAVEPNDEMRSVAEAQLSQSPAFRAVAAPAEQTTLPDSSIDAIVCAQSFHWFDAQAAYTEFKRILKPGGIVILIWNNRLTSGTPFLEAYEQLLLTYGTDYSQVNHRNTTQVDSNALQSFFGERQMTKATFPNQQLFDFEGLSGRLNSSSYVPAPDHPNYAPMMEELRRIFDRTEQNGQILFDYVTEVYFGTL